MHEKDFTKILFFGTNQQGNSCLCIKRHHNFPHEYMEIPISTNPKNVYIPAQNSYRETFVMWPPKGPQRVFTTDRSPIVLVWYVQCIVGNEEQCWQATLRRWPLHQSGHNSWFHSLKVSLNDPPIIIFRFDLYILRLHIV